MIPRLARALVRQRLRQNPAVALVGPRQAGKTTLARALSSAYFDLEQPEDRLRLDVEWDARVAARALLVLDEAQAAPDLFPRLRGAIDANRRRNGRFLLLGSVSPALVTQVSESLAGRLAVVELSPLLLPERPADQMDRLWLTGGFPDGGLLRPGRFPTWQMDYLTLLAQRDLPIWGLPAKAPMTMRLLKMLAALQGQVWNASQVGQGLGLSYHTVNTYVDVLEGAFLIRRLPPWLPNIRKRLVRAPRLHWRDAGLLHALAGVRLFEQLLHQPWVGASWEGFVIQQVTGVLAALGLPVDAHFFRTSDGHEIDLIFTVGTRVWAIEAKLSSRPSPVDLDRLIARLTWPRPIAGISSPASAHRPCGPTPAWSACRISSRSSSGKPVEQACGVSCRHDHRARAGISADRYRDRNGGHRRPPRARAFTAGADRRSAVSRILWAWRPSRPSQLVKLPALIADLRQVAPLWVNADPPTRAIGDNWSPRRRSNWPRHCRRTTGRTFWSGRASSSGRDEPDDFERAWMLAASALLGELQEEMQGHTSSPGDAREARPSAVPFRSRPAPEELLRGRGRDGRHHAEHRRTPVGERRGDGGTTAVPTRMDIRQTMEWLQSLCADPAGRSRSHGAPRRHRVPAWTDRAKPRAPAVGPSADGRPVSAESRLADARPDCRRSRRLAFRARRPTALP